MKSFPHSLKKSHGLQQFNVKKSHHALLIFATLHSFAVIAGFANNLAFLYKLLILLAITSHFFYFLQNHAKGCATGCLYYDPQDGWFLEDTSQERQPLRVLPSTVVSTKWVVLHFQLKCGKKRSLLIFNDSLTDSEYRALTVTLKIAGLCTDKEPIFSGVQT